MLKSFGHTLILVLLSLLTVVLTTACSSEDATTEQPVDILSRFNAEGKAWVSVDISLPNSGNGTRATTFDDDSDGEWAVNSVSLVLFSGASEADATWASTTTMDFTTPAKSGEPQITCTTQVSSQNIQGGDNVYLLVVLNATPTITTGQKLSQLTRSGITTNVGGTDYFVMSNTPVSSKSGGSNNPSGATVSTLVQIPVTFFQASEALAKANPVNVFVERAAVKVTVKDGVTTKTIQGNTAIDFATADINWALDNYNTSYYLTRQYNTSWTAYKPSSSTDYRMVEQSPLLTSGSLYRTYWGTDINYADGVTTDFTNYTNSTPSWKAMSTNDYCAENTMDVANMTDKNTTSVLVRLQLNGGKVFYTTSVTGSDVIFQEPGETLEEEGTSASSSFSRTRSTQLSGTNYVTISSYLRQWLMQFSDVQEWVETYAGGDPKHIRFTLTSSDAGKAGTVTFEATQTAQTISGSAGQTAWNDLNVSTKLSGITVTQYPSGYCYYRVLIRHFDDNQTPWTSASTMSKTDARTVYGNGSACNENDYLGRYGVVRNNWYTISIRSVSHVGSPVIPPLTTYADDIVEQMLNAKVVVSKWTVHEQKISY